MSDELDQLRKRVKDDEFFARRIIEREAHNLEGWVMLSKEEWPEALSSALETLGKSISPHGARELDGLTMTKGIRNSFFEIVKDCDFEPSSFEWLLVDSPNTKALLSPLVLYRNSRYYYLFDHLDGKHLAEFSPGPAGLVQRSHPSSWHDHRQHFSIWLNSLRQELEEPDLWLTNDEGSDQQMNLALIPLDVFRPTTDNSAFVEQEIKGITRLLSAMGNAIRQSTDLSAEQHRITREKLEYLEDAAKKHGRIDWLNIFVGTMVNILSSLSQTQVAYYLRQLCGTVLRLIG